MVRVRAGVVLWGALGASRKHRPWLTLWTCPERDIGCFAALTTTGGFPGTLHLTGDSYVAAYVLIHPLAPIRAAPRSSHGNTIVPPAVVERVREHLWKTLNL